METGKDSSTQTLIENEAHAYVKQQRHFTKWLNKLVTDVANELGMTLTKIQYVDGRRLGCRDAHLLKIGSSAGLVSIIIHEDEFAMRDDAEHTERAKCKIRGVLAKLQHQVDHQ